jgi:hypothetical protein
VHWVSRSLDIAREAAVGGEDLGEILAMERGDYRWRITVPPRRAPAGFGPGADPDPVGCAFPSCRPLPESGCRLMKLEAFHPEPVRIRASLAALGLASRLDVHPCGGDELPQMVAYVRTPRGLVELD